MELAEKLRGALGNVRVISGGDISLDFCRDEYPGKAFKPEAVIEARGIEDIRAAVKACAELGIPLTVRGAGTGQAGGSVPVKGGAVLSIKGMDAVLEIDEAAKTARVQAGVLLQTLKAEASKRGLYYPPDPGEETSTIGGNAATNAGGPCALKYGKTQDYILDAVLVLANGETVSLTELEDPSSISGSEGTLAVIAELTLRLIEKPAADIYLLLPFSSNKDAFDAAEIILREDYSPAMLEYMDTDLIEFSGHVTGEPVFPAEIDGERPACSIMLKIEGGSDDEIEEKLEQFAEFSEGLGCMDILVGDTPAMKRDFMTAYRAFHLSAERGAQTSFEINVDVPTGSIGALLEYAKEIGGENGFRVMANAHLGSGGTHIFFLSDRERGELAEQIDAVRDGVYRRCLALGGTAAGEYGVGYTKSSYLSEEQRRRFSALKRRFDPAGILNPGKIV